MATTKTPKKPVRLLARGLALALLAASSLGCISLSLKGEKVRLTKIPSDVAERRELGAITAEGPFGGPNDWKHDLQNKAAALGGDVVLYQPLRAFRRIHGTAYDCGGRYAKH